MQEIEVEYRAAVVAEGADLDQRRGEAGDMDPETRERVELRGKCAADRILALPSAGAVAVRRRGGIAGGGRRHRYPARTVGPAGTGAALGSRATRHHTGTGHGRDQSRSDPAGGVRGIPSRHGSGFEMPRVMSGTYATGTITTSQTASALAKSAAAVGAVGATAVTTATPKRVSARLELTLEDIAAVGQENFESILRQNLSLALSDALDGEMINGNGTAPNLAGIFQRLTDPTAAPTAVADFDAFVSTFAGGIDGLVGKHGPGRGGCVRCRDLPARGADVSGYRERRSWRHGIFRLCDGEVRGVLDEYADAGPGYVHDRGQRASGDSVPQGPRDDGRRYGNAYSRLPALGRGIDR